jgi:hypothetical protein
MMSEIHAKPIVDGKLWVVEQDGEKVATLSKQENNKFKLSGNNGELWFDEEDELLSKFGSKFFLSENTFKVTLNQNECHGFPTKTKPYNTMYDVRRRLPLYTKQPQSKCFHCAGWYIVKFKNWVVTQCPKLITIERYEYHGPFKTKAELNKFKCNLK